VVEVEAAQEHLIRLTRAAMLRDDESGHHLEDLAGPQPRPRVDLVGADDALRRGDAVAERVLPTPRTMTSSVVCCA
jgi:hypothetical protein